MKQKLDANQKSEVTKQTKVERNVTIFPFRFYSPVRIDNFVI